MSSRWDTANRWRVRVGSTYANSGGVVHNVDQIINHPGFSFWTADNDVGILRTATVIAFHSLVQPGTIAGANYNLADNQAVWAIGWGRTAVSIVLNIMLSVSKLGCHTYLT